MSDTRRKFPVGLTVATAISMAILCGLGGWQLQRLKWKTDLIANIEATKAQPPKPIVMPSESWSTMSSTVMRLSSIVSVILRQSCS